MKAFLPIFLFFSISLSMQAQFLDKKEDLKKFEGYFDFYYNENSDEIYLEVDKLDTEFLYTHFLTSGVGSNDIGLDRGQLGDAVVVKFKKAGNKLLLIEPNQKYRAVTDNDLERQSVKEAFARSVLFGFEIKEKKGEHYIIDLTPFLMQDAHGVAERLKKGKYGKYKIEKSKSALAMERTRAFPDNTEFEALLTFEGEPENSTIASVVPDAKNISVVEHHSFVKLPDDNYEKRVFDPRSGAIYTSYLDYASPVYEPVVKRFAIRHRLKKKHPEADLSEPVEPIIYYLDPGTPEPVRSALLEGASWWNQAFAAIGYKNAFQVKMLPEDADPLDVRYNVIQWVHRSTRGWSYGASVVDPRTGEIIKGHVSLGSLRIRQDFLIAQALLNKPFAENDENHKEMMEMALARIRQLAAHEVGHTLGFAHNFASSVNDRASVMDYPHPQLELKNGQVDLSNAYDTGIGEWDKVAVACSYADVPQAQPQHKFLDSIITKATQNGLQFITDSDARPRGGAHQNAHLWDNGKNAADELEKILKIRKTAIENFSVDNIRKDEPYSVLEDVFVPLYFLLRYQTEAAVKLIGGLDYNYAVKGGKESVLARTDKKLQQEAIDEVLKTLSAEVLAIPEDKLELFPPRAYGYGRSRESFKSNTGVAFDPLGAASTSSEMTLSLLLHPERAARLVQQKALDKQQPGFGEVLDQLISHTIKTSSPENAYLNAVQNTVNFNVLRHLMGLAISKNATPQVRARTNQAIADIQQWLKGRDNEVYNEMSWEIEQFRKNPDKFELKNTTPKIPDGSPIGSFSCANL